MKRQRANGAARRRVAAVVTAMVAAFGLCVAITVAGAGTAAAADDPCDLLDVDSVAQLFGAAGRPESTTVGSLPACRIGIGPLTLEALDAGDLPGEFDARLDAHGDSVHAVDDYVDGAFFGWGVGDAFEFVARRGSDVTIIRLTGSDRSGDFNAADPTAGAPDGDVSGSVVGSSMWVLMTEAFAVDSQVAEPALDDLSGLWRTTDITPCAPANDVGVRVSRFVDGGDDLRAVKVAGDTCLDNDETDFEGLTQGGRGSGVSFASVGSAVDDGTPYEFEVESATEVTLSGAAGALQYTLRYQRLSWPGLALNQQSALLGIPSPTEALTVKNVALTGALSTLLLLIVVFPTTLFNSALDANLDHYRERVAAFRRRFERKRSAGAGEGAGEAKRSFWRSGRGVVAYVVVAGVLFSLMQPGWGPNSITVVSIVGFIGGVAISSLLGVVASAVYLLFSHRNGRGRATVEPATLAIASFFVLASRVVGFVPGYMYGVLVSWDSAHEQSEFDRGRIVAFSSTITLIAAVVAWLLIPAFRDFAGPEPGIVGAIPLSIVGGLFVGSVESLTIGLVPLQFMPGHLLRSHSRRAWAVLWAGGGFLFVLVLLRPGLVSGASRSIIGTLVLVVISSVIALSFWLYETRRARSQPTIDLRASTLHQPTPPQATPPPVPPHLLPPRRSDEPQP